MNNPITNGHQTKVVVLLLTCTVVFAGGNLLFVPLLDSVGRYVESEGSAEADRNPVRIGHTMLFTAAAGLALAMVRLATSWAGEPELLFNMMVGAVWALANGFLIALPMLVATLKSRRLWLWLPLAVLLGCKAYAAFTIAGIVISDSPPDEEALLGMAGTLASLYVCLASVTLSGLRRRLHVNPGRQQCSGARTGLQKERKPTRTLVAEFVRIRAAGSRNVGSLTTSATNPFFRPQCSQDSHCFCPGLTYGCPFGADELSRCKHLHPNAIDMLAGGKAALSN